MLGNKGKKTFKPSKSGALANPKKKETSYSDICSQEYQIKEMLGEINRLNTIAKTPLGSLCAVFVWAAVDVLLELIFPRNIAYDIQGNTYTENAWLHRIKSAFIFFGAAYLMTYFLANRETKNTY